MFERFQSEPNTLALAVVDDDGRPLGIIERNAFTLRMAAEFGRALYARKPAESLMDRNAPVADAATSAETFFQAYGAAELGALLSGFRRGVERPLRRGRHGACRSSRPAPPCTASAQRR